jgi:hypothetical protein
LRKALFGVVIGALVFTAVALAATQNNEVKYTSTVKYKGKPSAKKPKNVVYNGILHVSTSDNKQPNTAPLTELFIARQLKSNGKRLKSCPKGAIDGKASIPAKCSKAVVGGGSAGALVGKPGQPATGTGASFPATFTVKVVNGPKGKQLFLVLNGAGTGNLNRVIAGKITKIKHGKFGLKVGFRVPKELQEPVPNNQAALTDFNVKVLTKRKAKVKHQKPASFFQVTKCPKGHKLPTKAVVHFNDDTNTQSAGTKTSRGTMTCH